MNLRAFLTINTILAGGHGIGFVFAPSLLLMLYQVAPGPGTALMGQLFGAELLFIAVLCWKVREFTGSRVVMAVAHAGVVSNIVGAVLCIMGVMGGVMGAMGWLAVAIYAVLAVGYLWVLKQGPEEPGMA